MHRRLALVAILLAGAAIAQNTRGGGAKWQDPSASPEERAADLVSKLTLEEKIAQMQNDAPAIPKLGIPAYDWWNEALHGVARAGVATVFPQAIGLAATFDARLHHQVADIISTEARAKYNDAIAHGNHARYYGLTFWSPNINIFRDPRWGRGQETYGEDPFLTARMAMEFIEGLQGSDAHYLKAVATAKHFAVHSGPESSRHQFDARASLKDLDNTYLYAFRVAVSDAHVASVMCAYNSVNGIPACANSWLLNANLRQASGFHGYVVSDCGAVGDISEGHQFMESLPQAAAAAVRAGTDLDCGNEYKALGEAVQKHFITEEAINHSVERLFAARFRLGMFDPPEKVPYSNIAMDVVESPRHQHMALEAAERSIVLLKNENNVLPLRTAPRSIAVIGPGADDPDTLLGNYNGIPSHIITPLQGIQQKFAHAQIHYALGSTYVSSFAALIPQQALTPGPENASQHGIRAEYFTSANFDGQPQSSRVEQRGYFVPQMQELPATNYAVRWTGTLQAASSGDYEIGLQRFYCEMCPGSSSARLFIDDKQVVENSWAHRGGFDAKTGSVHLEQGKAYSLRMELTSTDGETPGLELVWRPPADALLHEAVEAANQADVVFAVLGLNPRLEGEESKISIPGFDHGDRTDIVLPEQQDKLLQALLATGKPVIVILLNGSPLAIPTAKDGAKAILEAWYPGQEGGAAIADTLTGENNPSGRLPITFYESVKDLPAFSDYAMKNRTYRYYTGHPMYPFGYGLSYSDFKYSDLKVQTAPGAAGRWQVEAHVTNNSARTGDEIVQLYLMGSEQGGGGHRDVELRGFEHVHLEPDQTAMVRFIIARDDAQNKTAVSVGGGQPLKEWTGDHFLQAALPALGR